MVNKTYWYILHGKNDLWDVEDGQLLQDGCFYLLQNFTIENVTVLHLDEQNCPSISDAVVLTHAYGVGNLFNAMDCGKEKALN